MDSNVLKEMVNTLIPYQVRICLLNKCMSDERVITCSIKIFKALVVVECLFREIDGKGISSAISITRQIRTLLVNLESPFKEFKVEPFDTI